MRLCLASMDRADVREKGDEGESNGKESQQLFYMVREKIKHRCALENPSEENKVISLNTVTNEILKSNQFKVENTGP